MAGIDNPPHQQLNYKRLSAVDPLPDLRQLINEPPFLSSPSVWRQMAPFLPHALRRHRSNVFTSIGLRHRHRDGYPTTS